MLDHGSAERASSRVTLAATLPRLGELLEGKYRVLRVVADGGMGVVFEAHHELLGKSVALKFPLPELAHLPSVAERFLAEARLCARIDNEHVVRILDVSKLNGLPYIVMEFVNGASLAALLGSPWPPLKAVAFASQLLEGLEAVHALGVVHRDVKPENVLVVQGAAGPVLKLVDFGIAKDSIPQETFKRLTRSGTLLGTPAYMAPEQIRDPLRTGPGADVYSVGILLFEMLAGGSPFRATSDEGLASEALTGDLRPLLELAPDTPRALVEIVSRATALDVGDRYASAGELRRALEAFAAQPERDASRLTPPSPTTPASGDTRTSPVAEAAEPKRPPGKQDVEGRTLAAQVVAGRRRSAAVHGDSEVMRNQSGSGRRKPAALRAGALVLAAALALIALALVLTARQRARPREAAPAFVPRVTASGLPAASASPPSGAAGPGRPAVATPAATPAAPSAETPTGILQLWNDAHNRHDTEALRTLYADEVEFYGQRYTLTKVLAVKRQLFQRHADFKQASEGMSLTRVGSRTRADFNKTWLAAGATKSIGATLAVAPVQGQLRIVEETDDSVRAVTIECGGQRCGKVCCASARAFTCADSAAACPAATHGDSTVLLCDGPEDCRDGKVCCVDPADRTLLVACTPAEACTGTFVHPRSGTHTPLTTVCHADHDCPPHTRCTSLPDLSVRHCEPRPPSASEP
jgi:serine/threonine protein kinase